MPFSIRTHRRFPVCCLVTYHACLSGQGTVWNLSCTGWRLSGDLPVRPGETLSLTVTLPDERRSEIPEPKIRWSRGQGSTVGNISIDACHPPLALLLIRESQWDSGWSDRIEIA